MTVIEWLENNNVNYKEHMDPVHYYEILSDVCRYDVPDDKTYAIYFDRDDNIKVLIPDYDTLKDDSFVHDLYSNIYFGRLYTPNPMSINTVLEVM